MSSITSVTTWLDRLKGGDQDEPARRLWQAYFDRLVRRAHALLVQARCHTGGDAEDVTLSAFASFVGAVQQQRFPQLNDRDDLWRVLLTVTSRKAWKHIRREHSLRRGGGHEAPLSALPNEGGSSPGEPPIPGDEPDPAEAAALGETYERMMAALEKEDLRRAARWRLEGYSNEDIAARLGRSVGTAERKLRTIRAIWERFLEE
jgi:DNA-directed RNA polymerase specialized sigma24 family protein